MHKLLSRQVRLFEAAHASSSELKPHGIALKRQGIDTTRLYCNPDFLLLPLADCRRLSRLRPEQVSILTAAYFANTYNHTATAEQFTLTYNPKVSERVFPRYSDDYMVLIHETAEEYDHIICFHSLCSGLFDAGQRIGSPMFADYGRMTRPIDLFAGRVCDDGYGALYLLQRYLLNLTLKQTESFLFVDRPDEAFDPHAVAITRGHATDESRHLTTSLEVGAGLFERARPASRAVIRDVLRLTINLLIKSRFQTDLRKERMYVVSQEALDLALGHPDLRELGGAAELRAGWEADGVVVAENELYRRSKRWIASAIRRLAERLELRVPSTGIHFELYDELATRADAAA